MDGETPRRAGGSRPLSWPAAWLVVVLMCLAPIWLFFDPLTHYRLQTDDFAYVAGSRTWERTWTNLFVPHNTHVVPAWRVLCGLVVMAAGRLERLPNVMAPMAYGVLVATMLAVGWLVAREAGRVSWGLMALAAFGSTSILEAAGTWLSASQTLWAALGIAGTLLSVQQWARSGSRPALVAAVPLAWLAGGFWSVGHLAGVAGAAYLSGVGDRSRRHGAVVPLAASVGAVLVLSALKGRELETQVRVDGQTPSEAFSLVQGILYTFQAIPENLVFGNLGLNVTTTPAQGVLLTLALAVLWVASLHRARRWPGPMERAGLVLIGLSYVAEYGIRGYKPFAELRGVAVPWYNTIPQLGFVLFLAGWALGQRENAGVSRVVRPLDRRGAALALVLQAFLLLMNVPRVQGLWDANLPPMTIEDARRIAADPSYRRQRARRLAVRWVLQQRRDLSRLDRAEAEAQRRGIDREAIRRAFGRVAISELPEQYDAADMLDLPKEGVVDDPAAVRAALGRWLAPAENPPR
jgi:hypothetical protein